MCFYLLLPFFIIRSLSRANLGGVPIVDFLLVLVVAILGMSVLLILANILLRNRHPDSGPSFTSLFQGATRFHGFVALAIIGPLYGDEGISPAALALDAPATPGTGSIVVGERRYIDEALQHYRNDLGLDNRVPRRQQHPNNNWVLHGYHECLIKLGRDLEAKQIYPQFEQAKKYADIDIQSSCCCRKMVD